MLVDVIVPHIGEAVAELHLVRWLKRPGERVARGEILFEVDTDKTVLEVEAYEDGVLEEIVAHEGDVVIPLQRVGGLRVAASAAGAAPIIRTQPSIAEPPQAVGPGVPSAAAASLNKATPRARRLARDLGVDVAALGGGGGRTVTAADVVRAGQRGDGSRPLSRARSVVAGRTQQSKQRVPHFYLLADVDMTAALRLREARRAAGVEPPTITAIVVRACAMAVAANPEFNTSYVDGSLVARTSVGIGLAVGTENALVVAVIPEADTLDLDATAVAVREATRRAREGRLRESDLGPRSTVVSNLGMHGVHAFIAIIDEPDPFIVAVGEIRDVVVPIDGAPAIRPMTTLTLSVDHRALDGVQGARLLSEIRSRLERADES